MNRISVFLFIPFVLFSQAVMAVTCQNNIPPSNPDSSYTVHGDGTATDTRTGLMWKVCAEGQTWSSGTCTNNFYTGAARYMWAEALALAESTTFAGHSDWRLPNYKELRSLVEECRVSPTINESVFPNTPTISKDEPVGFFWSGTPYAGTTDWAETTSNATWAVSFDVHIGGPSGRGMRYYVRLVRGGWSGAIALPGAPTITRLIPGSGSMRIVFTPPANAGDAAISSYTASCSGNGVATRTTTSTTSPITVTGLTNGVSYSCTVSATNSAGTGSASASATKVVKPASIAPILPIILD